MPVMDVETYDDLVATRDLLLSLGKPATNPTIVLLNARIASASGAAARTVINKFEEIAASINAKARRARSLKDEDRSYNVDKLVYELKNVIITFQAAIDSFGKDVLATGGSVDARVGITEQPVAPQAS